MLEIWISHNGWIIGSSVTVLCVGAVIFWRTRRQRAGHTQTAIGLGNIQKATGDVNITIKGE